MSRTYVILTADEATNINFEQVLETSSKTLRWNNDKTKTFVKHEGTAPAWLEGKTAYTQAEMLTILNNPEGEWYTDPEGI
ncbi:hypothetical protein [Limnobacter sp.]|uniref:hypothetical protein n=1 Tax=Limnobacter sp. TaxID=2003368 RepID=UPI0025B7DB96|nr:hypothetical protein [Limnobacter sp.]